MSSWAANIAAIALVFLVPCSCDAEQQSLSAPLPITEIALIAGWSSLGSFGRTFRDVTGESPSELRARERAAGHQLDRVPHCFVSAARRPHLTTAVSEKRRRSAGGMGADNETEQGELS